MMTGYDTGKFVPVFLKMPAACSWRGGADACVNLNAHLSPHEKVASIVGTMLAAKLPVSVLHLLARWRVAIGGHRRLDWR